MSTDQLLRKYEYVIHERANGKEAVWKVRTKRGWVYHTESEALAKIRKWVEQRTKPQ